MSAQFSCEPLESLRNIGGDAERVARALCHLTENLSNQENGYDH